MSKRHGNAHGAVSAHVQSTDVIEKQYTCRVVAVIGFPDQGADENFVTPRFSEDPATECVVLGREVFAL